MSLEPDTIIIEETLVVTSVEENTNSALKYSILVTACIIMVLLLITGVCIFRCIAAKREGVDAAKKVQQLSQLERESESHSQFKPDFTDGK